MIKINVLRQATKEVDMVYKFRVYGDVDGLANVHESITQDGDAVIHTVYADNLSDALAEHMAQIDDGIFENVRYTRDFYLDGGIERPIIATPNGWEV